MINREIFTSISEKTFKKIEAFTLPVACSIIFLLSIFLRSTIDIGADTGVYLDLGRKIYYGGKYYYDFFESNFPLSFYFYAAQYHLSLLLNINPIITSEIVINLLAVLSIFYSAKILRRSTIYDHKPHYNLIVIAYLLSFFLRVNAVTVGEFGTKTSLLLICLYPYLSLSFERKSSLSKCEVIWRGILMGIMPCLKPHYLIFLIFIESQRLLKSKSLKFFLELDKLIMALIGIIYLALMMKFTPEFFEFIVPMWPKVYDAYDNYKIFFENVVRHFSARIFVFSFILLIFSRLKLSQNDKILTLLFCASSLLMVTENIGTIDQIAIFFAVTTICFLKFTYDFIISKEFCFKENKFIITTLIFLPFFDIENLPSSIFSLTGFINAWWIIAIFFPLFIFKKIKSEDSNKWLFIRKKILTNEKIFTLTATYLSLVFLTAISSFYLGGWGFIAANLFSLFVILFLFEKLYKKFNDTFSSFLIFTVTTSISCLLYAYIYSLAQFVNIKNDFQTPNKLTDQITYYSKLHAPEKDDGILVFTNWIAHQFPVTNYLGKYNHHKSNVAFSDLRNENGQNSADLDRLFTTTYLIEDLKKQLLDEKLKLLFINYDIGIFNKNKSCAIGTLEYYFLDLEFKKIFLEKFHFENRIFITEKIKNPKPRILEKGNIFNQVKPSSERIIYDFEVYVRNDKN